VLLTGSTFLAALLREHDIDLAARPRSSTRAGRCR
jgi:hypothetical protein